MNLTVASSPHIRGNFRTSRLMLDVIIALLPSLVVGVVVLGLRALAVTAVSIAVAVAAEYCKGEKYNKWVGEAKAFVIVTQEHAEIPAANSEARKRDFRQYDIGLMIENFCLEATELGLGTCILGLFNEEKLKSNFRIPSPKSIALVIAMGYPAESEIRKKQRKPLEDMITYLR